MREKISTRMAAAEYSLVRLTAIFFIFISFPVFGLIPLTAFLPLAPENKMLLSAGLFIASEIAFWGGVLVLGREAADRYRRYLSFAYWRGLLKNL